MSEGDERRTHPVYGYVDVPCIPLLDAVNRMEGLTTTYSCCGHGKQGFLAFITPTDVNKFSKLLYVLMKARRGWGVGRWSVELAVRTEDCPVAFMLSSESVGDVAYAESRTIAEVIEKSLLPVGTDKAFDAKWNRV